METAPPPREPSLVDGAAVATYRVTETFPLVVSFSPPSSTARGTREEISQQNLAEAYLDQLLLRQLRSTVTRYGSVIFSDLPVLLESIHSSLEGTCTEMSCFGERRCKHPSTTEHSQMLVPSVRTRSPDQKVLASRTLQHRPSVDAFEQT